MKDKFLKFFPLVKVDLATRMVYGLVTAEIEDKDGEICEYESTKPEYKAINDELGKASDGENIMPLREMHQLKAVGAGKSIEFDDSKKQIRMAFKVVDNDAWNKVLEHVLLGFSQGGKYLKRWTEDGKTYYTARPSEVSLVDNPCLPGAFIEYAKADGTVELFKTPDQKLTDADVDRIVKALEVTLGEKADVSELDTKLEKLSAQVASLMGQQSAVGADMNPEQIKKCAEALGITVEEFTKQYVEGDALEKGKKGLAALHAHLKKAHAHHEKMQQHHAKISEMHKAHGDMHGQMADHLENCMKAHGACMDGEEAEKVLKALVPEPEKKQDQQIDLTGFIKTEDATKMIDEAVKKAIGEQPEALKLRLVPRDGDLEKTRSASAPGGIPLS